MEPKLNNCNKNELISSCYSIINEINEQKSSIEYNNKMSLQRINDYCFGLLAVISSAIFGYYLNTTPPMICISVVLLAIFISPYRLKSIMRERA